MAEKALEGIGLSDEGAASWGRGQGAYFGNGARPGSPGAATWNVPAACVSAREGTFMRQWAWPTPLHGAEPSKASPLLTLLCFRAFQRALPDAPGPSQSLPGCLTPAQMQEVARGPSESNFPQSCTI